MKVENIRVECINEAVGDPPFGKGAVSLGSVRVEHIDEDVEYDCRKSPHPKVKGVHLRVKQVEDSREQQPPQYDGRHRMGDAPMVSDIFCVIFKFQNSIEVRGLGTCKGAYKDSLAKSRVFGDDRVDGGKPPECYSHDYVRSCIHVYSPFSRFSKCIMYHEGSVNLKREELALEIVKDFPAEDFRQNLIEWFKKEQRTLPWRENQDPYRVWVSEIMLQQTKVETVIPYYENFLRQFPTLEDLASADEQEVLKAWEGLGYYSRARNLQTAVKEVVAEYDSKVPDTVREIGSLQGVGPYTQGAILSIAYDLPVPAVDGNVMRVLSRILLVDEDIAKQSTRKLFEALVSSLISSEDPSSFNQGLMELGAIVCTPKSPSCLLCPVQDHCRAFHKGIENELPVKSSKKTQKTIRYRTYIAENEDGEILIEKRPGKGLLANLWQYPMVLEEEAEKGRLDGLKIEEKGMVDRIKHTFSHLIWEMEVHRVKVISGTFNGEQGKFVSKNELTVYPFPVSHQKIHPYIR